MVVILTPAMQSFMFGGGSFGFPLPKILFILWIKVINYQQIYKVL